MHWGVLEHPDGYAYVDNNPVNYTDPSGRSRTSLRAAWGGSCMNSQDCFDEWHFADTQSGVVSSGGFWLADVLGIVLDAAPVLATIGALATCFTPAAPGCAAFIWGGFVATSINLFREHGFSNSEVWGTIALDAIVTTIVGATAKGLGKGSVTKNVLSMVFADGFNHLLDFVMGRRIVERARQMVIDRTIDEMERALPATGFMVGFRASGAGMLPPLSITVDDLPGLGRGGMVRTTAGGMVIYVAPRPRPISGLAGRPDYMLPE